MTGSMFELREARDVKFPLTYVEWSRLRAAIDAVLARVDQEDNEAAASEMSAQFSSDSEIF